MDSDSAARRLGRYRDAAESFPGSRHLAGKTPLEVFESLTASDGDPLELFPRCAARSHERALLIDAERLYRRALAAVAFHAPSYRGDPELGVWLTTCIDSAIDHILREDRAEERQGTRLEEWDPRYEFLVFMVGVPPEQTRSAAVAFNGLRDDARVVWWDLCVDGRTVEEVLERYDGAEEYVRACAQAGFYALFLDDIPPVPLPPGSRADEQEKPE